MTVLSHTLIQSLDSLLPRGALLTDSAQCAAYGGDNSKYNATPSAVALVETSQQVQRIVQVCNDARVPIIGRGGGTNTTGASVPIMGGIVLSFERMNKVLNIDTANRYAIVEPGVLNGDLQRHLASCGFFWAPDPGSADYCTVGGNLACNAAGPRAVKYGSCRENTLGLEAITGSGSTIKTGTLTTKGAVGYDLTRLLIGSEGTLALITQATLKIIPLPQAKATLRAFYDSIESAALAVTRLMTQPEIPCALEFMDAQALQLVRHALDHGIASQAQALLMIEVDNRSDALSGAMQAIRDAAMGSGLLHIDSAMNDEQATKLWSARKALSPSLYQIAPQKINEDVVVPVSKIPALVAGLACISQDKGIPIVSFGHAGNGNLHVNLMFDPANPIQATNAPETLSMVFDLVISLGGTLSGEHGIGITKRDFIPRAIDAPTLAIMRSIKNQFDPNGILNPGKIFPH